MTTTSNMLGSPLDAVIPPNLNVFEAWSTLGSAFEAQARLWNHWLDTNRAFWSMAMPWLPLNLSAFAMATSLAPDEEAPDAEEAAPESAAGVVNNLFQAGTEAWQQASENARSFWMAMVWPWNAQQESARSEAAPEPEAEEPVEVADEVVDAPPAPRKRSAPSRRSSSRR